MADLEVTNLIDWIVLYDPKQALKTMKLRPSNKELLELLERGEELALTVECPNETCAALPGAPCQPYTHWVRVRDALYELPQPDRQAAMLVDNQPPELAESPET